MAPCSGRTREEILKLLMLLSRTKNIWNRFEDARRIVQRKLSRHFTGSHKKEFNKYVARRSSGRGNNRETWKKQFPTLF